MESEELRTEFHVRTCYSHMNQILFMLDNPAGKIKCVVYSQIRCDWMLPVAVTALSPLSPLTDTAGLTEPSSSELYGTARTLQPTSEREISSLDRHLVFMFMFRHMKWFIINIKHLLATIQ